jgi:hypothetical protein
LRLEGQPLDAQVVDQAVVLFLRMRDVCLRQQALSIKTLRRRLAALYRAGLLLAGYNGLLKADAGR